MKIDVRWLYVIPASLILTTIGSILYSMIVLSGLEPAWLIWIGLGSAIFILPSYVCIEIVVSVKYSEALSK